MDARQQANKLAERLRKAALRANLPYSIDDDTRRLTVVIAYGEDVDDEPDLSQFSRPAEPE